LKKFQLKSVDMNEGYDDASDKLKPYELWKKQLYVP
jgi:hypothetical protein